MALEKITETVIHWTHIGDGADKSLVTSMAENLLSKKKNIFYNFKGYLTNEEVMQFYSTEYFDCFVSTTKSEGLPVSMMEAISFGIPVIASNVGGVPEIVCSETGILLNPENCINELTDALYRFSAMPEEEIRNIRKRCRLFWETHHRAETQYTEFINKLKELL